MRQKRKLVPLRSGSQRAKGAPSYGNVLDRVQCPKLFQCCNVFGPKQEEVCVPASHGFGQGDPGWKICFKMSIPDDPERQCHHAVLYSMLYRRNRLQGRSAFCAPKYHGRVRIRGRLFQCNTGTSCIRLSGISCFNYDQNVDKVRFLPVALATVSYTCSSHVAQRVQTAF